MHIWWLHLVEAADVLPCNLRLTGALHRAWPPTLVTVIEAGYGTGAQLRRRRPSRSSRSCGLAPFEGEPG
jgi:hypothetical protein